MPPVNPVFPDRIGVSGFHQQCQLPVRERLGAFAGWPPGGGLDGFGSASGDIKYRIFAPDGTPLGPEATVNVGTAGQQGAPNVASLGDGSFVVVW